jgi:hypothetical protein
MTESLPDLIDPFQVDEIFFSAYQSEISDRSTAQLHDDYQIIWLSVPKEGYINHEHITLMRELIISELAHRKCIPMRDRLENRLKSQATQPPEA